MHFHFPIIKISYDMAPLLAIKINHKSKVVKGLFNNKGGSIYTFYTEWLLFPQPKPQLI